MNALFPILFGHAAKQEIADVRNAGQTVMVIGLPWPMIAAHEAQAKYNHKQTVIRLAERGGLGVCEAVAVLEDRPYRRMSAANANKRLGELLIAYEVSQIIEEQQP